MRLQVRQTLLSLFVILLVMGVFLYVFVGLQTSRLLNDARANGDRQLAAFLGHLDTLERTAGLEEGAALTTRRALVQYSFALYAHLLQSKEQAFSLVMAGEYLYNLSPLDPKVLLPMEVHKVAASRMLEEGGSLHLISARNIMLLQTPFTVYLSQDIAPVARQIQVLTRTAQWALIISLALCALILPPLIKRSLKPLSTLTRVADRIAGGDYALRAQVHTPDEVGALSASFDRMADTVASKITTLAEANQRQEMLIGALTHELKTPMTAIIGFSDSLLTMPLPEHKRQEALQEIFEAARRTERLSQKMMQLIALQHEELVKKPVQVKALFEQVGAALKTSLSEAALSLRLQVAVDSLQGDRDLLHSALTNLLDNAIKHASPGQDILLAANKQEGSIILSVTDLGRGIPESELARILQPFYRVDKARSRRLGGAGLGLALCQLIAQAHGGELLIESQLGQGTRASLVLPGEASHGP